MNKTSPSARHLTAVAALTLSIVLLPVSAMGSPLTLRRAIGNILQAPLDLVMSPVVAADSVVTNLRDVDDSTTVRVVYALPGFVWYTGVNMGASSLRLLTGALEAIVGVPLFLFEADLDTLMDPVDRSPAWYEREFDTNFPLLPDIKFGIDYSRSE